MSVYVPIIAESLVPSVRCCAWHGPGHGDWPTWVYPIRSRLDYHETTEAQARYSSKCLFPARCDMVSQRSTLDLPTPQPAAFGRQITSTIPSAPKQHSSQVVLIQKRTTLEDCYYIQLAQDPGHCRQNSGYAQAVVASGSTTSCAVARAARILYLICPIEFEVDGSEYSRIMFCISC